MPHAPKQRFFELLRQEPDVIVSRERAAQLARQVGYTDWPGFKPTTLPASERCRMTVVTSPDQPPDIEGTRRNGRSLPLRLEPVGRRQ